MLGLGRRLRWRRGGGIGHRGARGAALEGGLLGIPDHAAYSAAKGGVISLTKQLAVDYGPEGITVNCICPGEVDAPMGRRPRRGRSMEQVLQERGTCYPLRRIGQPEDIANTALFLVSDEASWITGVILPVDGGYACQ